MDNQTIGIIAGTTLATVEITSVLACTVFGSFMRRNFPRVSKHLATGMKTTSYRMFAGLDTFGVAWFVTGNPMMGVGVVGLEFMTKFFLYYGHEWLWRTPYLAKLLLVQERKM